MSEKINSSDEGLRAPDTGYADKGYTGKGDAGLDVFGSEENHQIKYRTLSWQMVAILMIAEIVSNGMLSLPSTLALVGLVPGLILIVFLGIFATYTSWLLIQFKLRHPDVHTMGDAGYIMFGVVGRDVLAFGTVIYAILATGSQLLAGQIALSALSDNKLCTTVYTAIFTAPTVLISFPRTFDSLGWISIPSVLCISIAGLIGMIIAGTDSPAPLQDYSITVSSNFDTAFTSVTNIIFAYAGHFMFFVLISEMRKPRDAMKAAWTLQSYSTVFYSIFAAITYVYIGNSVTSPSFSSLSNKWAKTTYGIALPNFLIAGALYSHTASKLIFVRMFRHSKHLHSHTVLGWGVWTILILITNGAGFVFAVGVPIFNYLIGIAASLFAAWFSYGLAGFFFMYDTYQDEGGVSGWRRRWFHTSLAVFTIAVGAFFCVAGTYVNIKGVVVGYQQNIFPKAFAC